MMVTESALEVLLKWQYEVYDGDREKFVNRALLGISPTSVSILKDGTAFTFRIRSYPPRNEDLGKRFVSPFELKLDKIDPSHNTLLPDEHPFLPWRDEVTLEQINPPPGYFTAAEWQLRVSRPIPVHPDNRTHLPTLLGQS